MRLTGSRAYYRSTPPKLPSGLVELIEGLTRDVLKNNPTDIYGFCANHMHQLLEIRDGPTPKKPLTLEEKIARAQQKVRQRAEQRWQQYTMNLRQQQLEQGSETKPASTEDDGSLTTSSQEPTAVNLPVNTNSEMIGAQVLETDPSPVENSSNQNREEVEENPDNLNKDTDDEPVRVHVTESMNEAGCKTPENCPTDAIPKNDEFGRDARDDNVDKTAATTRVGEDLGEGKIIKSEEDLRESQELVTATNLQEPDIETNIQQHSNPIHSLIMNQGSVLLECGDKIIDDSVVINPGKSSDNKLLEEILHTPIVDVPAKTTEPQTDQVLSSLNPETEQSTEVGTINIIDDSTNSSNVVENADPTNNVNNNGNEDPNETNTINISFKELPNVELQDSMINLEMLESLPETNKDNDIVTLITQDSNNEITKENSLKHGSLNAMDSNSTVDLPQVTKQYSESHVSVADQPQHRDNEINGDSIENKDKENNVNGNQSFERSKLVESSLQILGQDSNMDLETAAVTIQKVFRSFLFKSRASTFDETGNDDDMFLNEELDKNKDECDFPVAGSINERRPHGLTRMDTVLQTVNEEKSLSLSTDDSSTLSSAATVIQAHVRGFLVRNKLNSNKTISTNSLAASNSNEPSLTSLEMDNEQNKNKTVLNIHIVPEGGNYLSRDESLITSMDLSLDSSPPSSINLHPLGYDKSERRKQLKREDAIQSISPPSNNSSKLSEDVDSVKELPLNDHEVTEEHKSEDISVKDDLQEEEVTSENVKIPSDANDATEAKTTEEKQQSLVRTNSDEMDVVTPFRNEDNTKLMHSGEFHDAVLPTKVSRSDTSVASEFKNVLVYFLLWNNS
ncbi:SUN domain-containing protein 2-like isoform X1 [Helicoverpa zea]|uniref:SUN domain-containing protein 2-like isoform X1 n=1 Tax=Helicoverpa zea TaxID=7113 RepID=UPI001F55E47A|nr:SUN domain-containing protein 2-like isoform X1 [Helicoverpa zea]